MHALRISPRLLSPRAYRLLSISSPSSSPSSPSSSSSSFSSSTSSSSSSLPLVPLPSVSSTCERYLESVSPLLSQIDFESTREIVESFKNEKGTLELQKTLVGIEKRDQSFIKGFWDDMYLNGRWALPINSNPFLTFNSIPREGLLSVASALTVSSLMFAQRVRSGQLERTTVKGVPLCMSQFPKMFGATRIPKLARDVLAVNSTSRHIAVLVNGDIYLVDVITPDGKIRTEKNLAAIFDAMIKQTRSEIDDTRGLGVFTTADRDDWAKIRAELESNAENKAALEAIDSAIFAVCLDANDGAGTPKALSQAMLHGNVNEQTPLNRWFDKSISLIIDGTGSSAVNFEHTWGDGLPVGRYMQEVHSHLQGTKSGFPPLTGEFDTKGSLADTYKKVKFNLNESLRGSLNRVAAAYKEATENVDTAVLVTDLGTNAFKKAGLSPDGTIQMAIQLAYQSLYNRVVSTYESCNVQHFRYGRTETIRSATQDALKLVTRFDKSNNQEAFDLLKRATKTHAQVAENAKIGKGTDRHLYALLCVAQQRNKERGEEIPQIFRDPSYLKYTSNILSTSTVSGPFTSQVGFGAVNPGGYGIGYNAADNKLTFNITSFRNHPGTDSGQFAQSLSESFKKFLLCFPQA